MKNEKQIDIFLNTSNKEIFIKFLETLEINFII